MQFHIGQFVYLKSDFATPSRVIPRGCQGEVKDVFTINNAYAVNFAGANGLKVVLESQLSAVPPALMMNATAVIAPKAVGATVTLKQAVHLQDGSTIATGSKGKVLDIYPVYSAHLVKFTSISTPQLVSSALLA